MSRLLLLNKPYGVTCQFSAADGRRTLSDFVPVPGVYPAGRLDADSEGLVVLTDDGALQHRITDPRHKMPKTYLVQIEGEPTREALALLRGGITLNDGRTRPARVRVIDDPQLWLRDPPIRVRRAIPTRWIEMVIREGRNRQIRRMTAAVGHPTLRLVRLAVGPFTLGGLAPGEWRETRIPAGLAPVVTPRRAGRKLAASRRSRRGVIGGMS
jgi:23S rRNA pseudouridine2457 synthase